MRQELFNLLAMIPEEKHEVFLSRLPADAVAAIANEAPGVDEAMLSTIAEVVWVCLEEWSDERVWEYSLVATTRSRQVTLPACSDQPEEDNNATAGE